MDSLRQYVISIIVAAVATAILGKVTESTHAKKCIKMVIGLVLSVVLLSPIGNVNISSYLTAFESVEFDANEAVVRGEEIYKENMDSIIRQQCESYILDKARQLGAEINVEILCDTSEIPIPIRAQITGTVSPYVRKSLQNIISKEIGIPEDAQIWK